MYYVVFSCGVGINECFFEDFDRAYEFARYLATIKEVTSVTFTAF